MTRHFMSALALVVGSFVPATAHAAGTQAVQVTATTLNVRASAWGTIVGTAPADSGWVLTGQKEQGFVEIYFRGRRAWISAGFTKPLSGSGDKVTAATLDVRATAATAAKIVGQAHANEVYYHTGDSGVWERIRFDENLRWVHGGSTATVALGSNAPATTTTSSTTASTNSSLVFPAWLKTTMARAVADGGYPSWWATAPSLQNLVYRESSFDPTAQNPSSTAYGLFQFLDSTWATVGGTKTSDAYRQCVYGLKYIKQRYGDPDKAWTFWVGHHWY